MSSASDAVPGEDTRRGQTGWAGSRRAGPEAGGGRQASEVGPEDQEAGDRQAGEDDAHDDALMRVDQHVEAERGVEEEDCPDDQCRAGPGGEQEGGHEQHEVVAEGVDGAEEDGDGDQADGGGGVRGNGPPPPPAGGDRGRAEEDREGRAQSLHVSGVVQQPGEADAAVDLAGEHADVAEELPEAGGRGGRQAASGPGEGTEGKAGDRAPLAGDEKDQRHPPGELGLEEEHGAGQTGEERPAVAQQQHRPQPGRGAGTRPSR